MPIPTKNDVLNACIAILKSKLSALETSQNEQLEDAASQGKSTAGDKHDTAIAMAHIEQEQQKKIWQETTRQLQFYMQPQWRTPCNSVAPGALIETEEGLFLMVNAIGKIEVGSQTVMTLSAASPLGQAMLGKIKGQQITVGNKPATLLSIQ